MLQNERMNLMPLITIMVMVTFCRSIRDDSKSLPGKFCPSGQVSDCLSRIPEKIFSSCKKLTWNPYQLHLFFLILSHIFFLAPPAYQLWFQDVAIPNKIIGVVHIFCPKWPKVLKSDLQPRFWLAIIMDNCSLLNTLNVSSILIAQAKHVPGWVNRMNMTFKCYQSRR